MLQRGPSPCSSVKEVQEEGLKLRNFWHRGRFSCSHEDDQAVVSHCFPVFIHQLVVSWACNQLVKPLAHRPTFWSVFAESVPGATVSAGKKSSALPWKCLCILGVKTQPEQINVNGFTMYAKSK